MKKKLNQGKSVLDPAPKSSLNVETWISLSALTRHWQSDLEFFEDELRFLHTLINKYFLWLIDEENIVKTRKLVKKLVEIETRRNLLFQKTEKHLKHLQGLIENPFSHDAHVVNIEHSALEEKIADFVKEFRSLKHEVFALTEHILESEKVQHMLKQNTI